MTLRAPRSTTTAALLTLLACAGASGARAESGLVYGEGFSFSVTAPSGWVLDNTGVERGLQAAFYRKGEAWKSATTVMYVNTDELEEGESLDDLIESDAQDFRDKAGGHMRIETLPAIVSSTGDSVPVRSFSGDRWSNHEAVAYLKLPTVVVLAVMSSRSEADFRAALPAFRSMVKSIRSVGDGKDEVFEAALAAAEANLKTPAGERYDATIGREFGRFASVMKQCTDKAPVSETQPFDLLACVGVDGSVENVLTRPKSSVPRCLAEEVRKSRFSPPPGPGWWVRIHMEIRP